MALALREAHKGRPSPNPHVGAVIVKSGTMLSSGYHERAGLAHAEVVAMERSATSVKGATLYVTLEPCNHQGRTGPCTDAILAAGIGRVVIGCTDPMPHVKGAIEKLKAGGIEVDVGVLQAQAERLVAGFVKHRSQGLPYVILKAAVSLDGRIATRSGQARWITSDKARTETHAMRMAADAILVGVNTVLKDDPWLTVRHVKGVSPVRVILDSRLRTPPQARLFQSDASAVWLMHAEEAPEERKRALRDAGARLLAVPSAPQGLDLKAVLQMLGEHGVVNLLVEGGATVYNSFLKEGLVDRMAVFVAPLLIGDPKAPALATFRHVERMTEASRLRNLRIRRFGTDVLFEGDVLKGGLLE